MLDAGEMEVQSQLVYKLVRQLVLSDLVPGRSITAASENDLLGLVESLTHGCIEVLQSQQNTSAVDEGTVLDALQRKLMRNKRDASDSIKIYNLYQRLCSQGLLARTGALLSFLSQMSQPVTRSSGRDMQDLQHSYSRQRTATDHRKTPLHTRGFQSGKLGVELPMTPSLSAAAGASSRTMNGFSPAIGQDPDEVPESALLRDIIFVFQGIDGRYIRYNESEDSYVIDADQNISKPNRDLLYRLSELGWLYKRITECHKVWCEEPNIGLVGQSFCSSIQSELTEYYKLIAVLEAQTSKEEAPATSSQATLTEMSASKKGLTLKRVLVWVQDVLQRFRLLSVLAEACLAERGGGLVSLIYSYTNHGDPFIQSFINSMLIEISKPFFELLQKWIYEGELEDAYQEFFVACDDSVEEENLWQQKYSLRLEMLPSFISKSLAQKIFSVGKSLNFIRHSCHEGITPSAIIAENVQMMNYADLGTIESSIDIVYQSTSQQLLGILMSKYKLMEHLSALKRYLLLGQGDFMQNLMTLIGPYLDKPGSSLFRHHLTETLESAVLSSNAQYDDPEILSRLDVRLLEVSPGETGWEVFTLDYHVDSPMNTIFTPSAMSQYLTLFNFLWRLKRVEYTLSATWRRMVTSGRKFGQIIEITSDLQQARLTMNEMIHFIYQLQYYYLFEVLECSWEELTTFLKKCIDLDSMIDAHARYLRDITTKGFLQGQKNQILSEKLKRIFQATLHYASCIDKLITFAISEVSRREELQRTIERRKAKGTWGLTAQDENMDRIPERFIEEALNKIRSRLDNHGRKFRNEVQSLLGILASYQDDDLMRSLSTRLDYNEFYRQKATAVSTFSMT